MTNPASSESISSESSSPEPQLAPRNDTTSVYSRPPHVLPGTYADWKERLQALPGYLSSERQREFMFQLGASCTIGIELGTFKGLSACIVAAGMLSVDPGKRLRTIYCVDTFEMTTFELHDITKEEGGTFAAWQRSVQSIGAEHLCVPVQMNTDDSPDWFRERLTDLADYLYVDADHGTDATMKATRDHLPFVRPGGLVIFHDAAWRCVDAAIQTMIGNRELVPVARWDDCFVCRRPSGS